MPLLARRLCVITATLLTACSAAEPPEPDPTAAGPGDATPRHRIVAGVSMGAYGAAYMGTRFPELFDSVAAMGGPVDLDHSVHIVRHWVLGGFLPEEAALPFTHEAMSMGIDVSPFDRKEYMRLLQDMALIFGNIGNYNPDNSYWPPGVDSDDTDAVAQAQSCGPNRHELLGFYDAEYNNPASPYCADYPGATTPDADGLWPVITYCEGHGIEDPPHIRFDPSDRATPTELGLAVDCNGNGRRDLGEPVIRQMWEPWRDTGRDGVPSTMETGYDPRTRPDPAGDDYHPRRNPGGTEGNLRFDPGEPFEDTGLDGIAGVSNLADDPFEGNGRFDRNPHFETVDRLNPARCVTDAAVDHLRFYLDGGLRDSFQFQASSERFLGALKERGHTVRLVRGFQRLGELYGDGDLNDADYRKVTEQHLMVRYGEEELSWEEAFRAGGDGGHVGSPLEVVERFVTVFSFLMHTWKDLPRHPMPFEVNAPVALTYTSELLGDDVRDVVVNLPPGYHEQSERRYPVIYFFHGHGMTPEVIGQTGLLLNLLMAQGRLRPALMVAVDGRVVAKQKGSFYVNHFDTSGQDPYPYVDAMLQEVMPMVEHRFRVLADPADLEPYQGDFHDRGCGTDG